MAESAVAITAGSGTSIDTYQVTGGDHQQVVREARGTSITNATWTISTTAKLGFVPADPARVMVLLVNRGSGRVYLRFSASLPLPSATVCDWYLDTGDRYEVPTQLTTYAISVVGDQSGGTLNALLAIAS